MYYMIVYYKYFTAANLMWYKMSYYKDLGQTTKGKKHRGLAYRDTEYICTYIATVRRMCVLFFKNITSIHKN